MSTYLLLGLSLGLILIGVHLWNCKKRDEQPGLEVGVTLVLSAFSVTTGARVIAICVLADSLKPFSDEDRVYIALGGVALIWVSLVTIHEALRSRS